MLRSLFRQFDFITTDRTRYGYPCLYGYDDVVERRYSYLEVEPYGGIPELLEKLNSWDESVADVLESTKCLVRECQSQKMRIVPVHWLRDGYRHWLDVIIDTAYGKEWMLDNLLCILSWYLIVFKYNTIKNGRVKQIDIVYQSPIRYIFKLYLFELSLILLSRRLV